MTNEFLTAPEPVSVLTGSADGPAPTDTPPVLGLMAGKARILYVDDEPQLRSLGEVVLARSGYAVDTAADGAEAWGALHDQEYQLLITDCHMPGVTGLELIRKVRNARMSVPIILASSIVNGAGQNPAWCECSATLAKPFTSHQLVAAVRDVLRMPGGTGTSTSGESPAREKHWDRIQSRPSWGINE